jgi:hypothetical protein
MLSPHASSRSRARDRERSASRNERLSAGGLARLLVAADLSKVREELARWLAVAALDGTVQRRFQKQERRWPALLKTGSLEGVARARRLRDRRDSAAAGSSRRSSTRERGPLAGGARPAHPLDVPERGDLLPSGTLQTRDDVERPRHACRREDRRRDRGGRQRTSRARGKPLDLGGGPARARDCASRGASWKNSGFVPPEIAERRERRARARLPRSKTRASAAGRRHASRCSSSGARQPAPRRGCRPRTAARCCRSAAGRQAEARRTTSPSPASRGAVRSG